MNISWKASIIAAVGGAVLITAFSAGIARGKLLFQPLKMGADTAPVLDDICRSCRQQGAAECETKRNQEQTERLEQDTAVIEAQIEALGRRRGTLMPSDAGRRP